jgi:Tfp pilus assembly protein PilX
MNKQACRDRSERGVALIMALLMVLVLGLLAATVMFTSQAQGWTGLNYRLTAQSRYAAEAGIQSTMNWLASSNYTVPTTFTSYDMTKNPVQYNGNPVVLSAMSGVSSNYPDPTVVAAFSSALSKSLAGVPNASFSSYATLLRMNPAGGVSWLGGGGAVQTWQITSQGSVGGIRNATVQVAATYERTGTPVFNYGIEATSSGCKAVDFQGSDYTDSYNSNLGVYGGTNLQASGGNIASNGNVNLGRNAVINGTISVPNTTVGACPDGITNGTGKAVYDQGTNKLNSGLVAPLPWGCKTTPCYPSPLPPTTTQNVSASCSSVAGCTSKGTTTLIDGGRTTSANVYTLAPGLYGNLQIGGADVVHVTAGTYTVNSLNFLQDGQIVVDSGPVVFNLAGQCASGCPSEGGYNPSTSVLWGAGFAGFNACSGGVTANPDVYGKVTCGPSKAPFSGIPSNFQVVYGGTDLIRVGGMPNAMVSYAPLSAYYAPGAPVGLFGSIVTGTFDDASQSPFHYDNALQSSAVTVGQYRPVGGFSWTKF